MNCPKCNQPLEAVELRGTQVDKCPTCRGVWFDESELEVILELTPADLRPLRGNEDEAFNRLTGACPRDGCVLARVYSALDASVVVDACPTCRGVWLDGGELQRLKR